MSFEGPVNSERLPGRMDMQIELAKRSLGGVVDDESLKEWVDAYGKKFAEIENEDGEDLIALFHTDPEQALLRAEEKIYEGTEVIG